MLRNKPQYAQVLSYRYPVVLHVSQDFTFHSWTPITANKKLKSIVTSMMFQIVFTATKTHCTTCCKNKIFANTIKMAKNIVLQQSRKTLSFLDRENDKKTCFPGKNSRTASPGSRTASPVEDSSQYNSSGLSVTQSNQKTILPEFRVFALKQSLSKWLSPWTTV